ncbi:hypothetical protein LINPERHAP1_LOCUS19508 [Linum perenne]
MSHAPRRIEGEKDVSEEPNQSFFLSTDALFSEGATTLYNSKGAKKAAVHISPRNLENDLGQGSPLGTSGLSTPPGFGPLPNLHFSPNSANRSSGLQRLVWNQPEETQTRLQDDKLGMPFNSPMAQESKKRKVDKTTDLMVVGQSQGEQNVGLQVEVLFGKGVSKPVNADPWIPSLPKYMTPFNGCSTRYASDWIDPDTREWDVSTFGRFFSPVHIRAILAVPIGQCEMKDEWKWNFTNDGAFSVRSAYHVNRTSRRHLDSAASVSCNDRI